MVKATITIETEEDANDIKNFVAEVLFSRLLNSADNKEGTMITVNSLKVEFQREKGNAP